MLDVRKYQIAASIAEERSEMLRAMQEQQTSLLADRTTKLDRAAEETNELYTYLDTQMLASARERQGYEAQLRQAERRRKEELADLTTRMELQQATASEMIRALRVELKERSDEVEALHEHQLKGPERDAEIARLKEKLTREEQAIQEERSSMHLKEFKLRKDLNQEMYARIHQAKANFLDITGSMLDSTVHRTLLQNQHMQELTLTLTLTLTPTPTLNLTLTLTLSTCRRTWRSCRSASSRRSGRTRGCSRSARRSSSSCACSRRWGNSTRSARSRAGGWASTRRRRARWVRRRRRSSRRSCARRPAVRVRVR